MATNSHECPKCGLDCKYASYLRRHLARKTPCAPILDLEDLPEDAREDPDLDQKKCRFCGRVFSSYDVMRRHVRQYCKIAPTEKNGDAGMEVLYEHTLRKQQAQIAKLEEQNAEMMGMMRQLVEREGAGAGAVVQAPTGTQAGEVAVQGNGNQVDNRKTTVVINIFGSEDLAHIQAPEIKAILDSSLRAGAPETKASTAILQTALLAYSDPDHPENLTCYLPNKKTDDALVHGNAGWEVRPCPLVLAPMAQQSLDQLFDKQPFESAETYESLMAELRDNEERYATGEALRPVLVRNKDLLARALESLPVAGTE